MSKTGAGGLPKDLPLTSTGFKGRKPLRKKAPYHVPELKSSLSGSKEKEKQDDVNDTAIRKATEVVESRDVEASGNTEPEAEVSPAYSQTRKLEDLIRSIKAANTTKVRKRDLVEESSAIAAPEPNKPDRKQLCIEILIEGHVNAYVDFFYLTHREEEDPQRAAELNEKLPFIKTTLGQAESAHRQGNPAEEYDAFKTLADLFKSAEDYKTAVYFYEKCLEIAETMGDAERQCVANLNLGIAHSKVGAIAKAIKFHEKHLEIAKAAKDASSQEVANRHLVDVYRRMAEEHENQGRWEQAVALHQQELAAAVTVGDAKAQGLANYRLGLAFGKIGDHRKAVDYEKEYVQLCKKTGDQLGEGAALSALANSYQALGDTASAVKYLEQFLEVGTVTKQTSAQASAYAQLGQIYSAQGNAEKAVECFEKNYEIARQLGNRQLVDSARIYLGMARGRCDMQRYMNVVNNDLPSLLEWKSKRAPLPKKVGSRSDGGSPSPSPSPPQSPQPPPSGSPTASAEQH